MQMPSIRTYNFSEVGVKVEETEPEEAAVEAMAVKEGDGNDLPQVSLSMIFHLNGTFLVSRILHWLAFLVVVGMLVGGQLLGVLPDGSIKSIAVHAAAALKPHYIDGDRTLIRMLKSG